MSLEYTCNKCGTDLIQHKKKKSYFYCSKCEAWYKCWLPKSELQIKKAIDRIRQKGYDV